MGLASDFRRFGGKSQCPSKEVGSFAPFVWAVFLPNHALSMPMYYRTYCTQPPTNSALSFLCPAARPVVSALPPAAGCPLLGVNYPSRAFSPPTVQRSLTSKRQQARFPPISPLLSLSTHSPKSKSQMQNQLPALGSYFPLCFGPCQTCVYPAMTRDLEAALTRGCLGFINVLRVRESTVRSA